ncbi:uncharacterized protein LOC123695977 isoform X1 [Colias croceus]|uniref:uncharacterized protein LOC123695977 isoform X1 n=1 Tax=Colias crocea TaxID=72248 RepID=UPI001E27FDE5|nr:uncharacterized protein LOC123695977 isoform X1 [Colias croceus]
MQYYKLLAQEVEKRINTLKIFMVESDTESIDDKTDAPDLPESEHNDNLSPTDIAVYNANVTPTLKKEVTSIDSSENNTSELDSPNTCEIDSISKTPSKFIIDLSISLNDSKTVTNTPNPVEVPERDWECTKNVNKDVTDISNKENLKSVDDKLFFSISLNNDFLSDPLSITFDQEGPPSLSSKSFTGSLNNIHTESIRDSKIIPLSRQRSYTVLKPSPLLMAHLEVQSLNTGVEINSISMSESMSNLSCPNKKRRSWDLETAKVKWSSMALELKQNSLKKTTKDKNGVTKSATKKVTQSAPVSHSRARSLVQERNKRVSNIYKPTNKSEPIPKTKKNQSPVRNQSANPPVSKTNSTKISPIPNGVEKKAPTPKQLISESEDPAARVRELYEKIQKQQLIQMASLVEKQKKEQMLLQQVFEEQNNLLYSQLKTICPKPSNDVKEAWGDKDTDRGPVSLSQLINSEPTDSPVVASLTETNNYINHCDNVLKKSRDITGSIKKATKCPSKEKSPPKSQSNVNCTKSQSPGRRSSRKLTYDSASTDRDYDLILTDRTNDTMADLNVTFPSDNEECQPYHNIDPCNNDISNAVPMQLIAPCKSTDRAIKSMEETIQNSIKSMCGRKPRSICRQATPQEIAAATKIVAHVKGYLVRRLMRTERVQGTVQTIKDALLCALQLHQDREGIRGADVDLHRRLIQQITAACYTLHDTFITSTAAERCAMIAADRGRRRSLASRPPPRQHRPTDLMSQSHCGAFPPRAKRAPTNLMTQSNYGNIRIVKLLLCTSVFVFLK